MLLCSSVFGGYLTSSSSCNTHPQLTIGAQKLQQFVFFLRFFFKLHCVYVCVDLCVSFFPFLVETASFDLLVICIAFIKFKFCYLYLS